MSWKTHLSTNSISIFSLSFFYNLHVLSNLVLYSLFSLSASNPLFFSLFTTCMYCAARSGTSCWAGSCLGAKGFGRFAFLIFSLWLIPIVSLFQSNAQESESITTYSIFRISQYLLIIYGEVNTCRVLGDFPQEFWNVNTESEGEKYVLQHGTNRKHNSDEF